MENLTREQETFLSRYVNSKADVYNSLQSMGLEIEHLISWTANPLFDLAYRQARQKVILWLNQENYTTALRKLNEILENGVIHHTVTHEYSPILEAWVEKRTVKTSGVPSWAIKEGLKESNITKAIQQLSNEGVIPMSTARRLHQTASKITTELQQAFGENNAEEQHTDQKVVSLIKQAVLGSLEEIG